MCVSRALYFVIAAEARRVRLPFGGHTEDLTGHEAIDSGATFLDHDEIEGGPPEIEEACMAQFPWGPSGQMLLLAGRRLLRTDVVGTLARCQTLAAMFRAHNAWWVPTWIRELTAATNGGQPDADLMTTRRTRPVMVALIGYARQFWTDTVANPYAPGVTGGGPAYTVAMPDTTRGVLRWVQAAGLPVLAGADATFDDGPLSIPGFSLHTELALLGAEGLTPLAALQSATLNPAKSLHLTDSLGTVGVGKLADLVLLRGNPLSNIGNTTTIQAVVANGHYYDRVALDRILSLAQRHAKAELEAAATANRTPQP